MVGARGGSRTPTVARWILSPVRLPVPPLSQIGKTESLIPLRECAICFSHLKPDKVPVYANKKPARTRPAPTLMIAAHGIPEDGQLV